MSVFHRKDNGVTVKSNTDLRFNLLINKQKENVINAGISVDSGGVDI